MIKSMLAAFVTALSLLSLSPTAGSSAVQIQNWIDCPDDGTECSSSVTIQAVSSGAFAGDAAAATRAAKAALDGLLASNAATLGYECSPQCWSILHGYEQCESVIDYGGATISYTTPLKLGGKGDLWYVKAYIASPFDYKLCCEPCD